MVRAQLFGFRTSGSLGGSSLILPTIALSLSDQSLQMCPCCDKAFLRGQKGVLQRQFAIPWKAWCDRGVATPISRYGVQPRLGHSKSPENMSRKWEVFHKKEWEVHVIQIGGVCRCPKAFQTQRGIVLQNHYIEIAGVGETLLD